jgi:hypothetical protein
MRRFDFDVESVVRLSWHGVEPIKIPAPVRYFRPDQGGVSHFNYWRDNALLVWMHARLLWGFLLRAPPAAAPPSDLVAAPADTYIMASSAYRCP